MMIASTVQQRLMAAKWEFEINLNFKAHTGLGLHLQKECVFTFCQIKAYAGHSNSN